MRRLPLGVTPAGSYGSGSLLRPDADSGGTPNVCRDNAEPTSIVLSPTNITPTPPPQGTPMTTTATATPTAASLLETVYPGVDPRAADRCTASRCEIDDYSGARRRSNPSGRSRVQPVPMEPLD